MGGGNEIALARIRQAAEACVIILLSFFELPLFNYRQERRNVAMRLLSELNNRSSLIRSFILPLAATAVFLSGTILAEDVWVDCAHGGSIQAALNSLPAPPPNGRNQIFIQGPCTENVSIVDQRRLWLGSPLWWGDYPMAQITAASGSAPVLQISGSQEIYLSRLILTGGQQGLSVTGGSVVSGDIIRAEGNSLWGIVLDGNSSLTINDGAAIGNRTGIVVGGSSNLSLRGNTPWFPPISGHQPFVISGNGGSGIFVDRSKVSIDGAVDIHGNLGGITEGTSGAGIESCGGTLGIGTWEGQPNLIRGNSIGIWLREGSQLSLWGGNTVRDNSTGVAITEGSTAVFWEQAPGPVTIEGNLTAGVMVTSHGQAGFHGHNIVRSNGSAAEPLRAGIRVDGTSQVFLEGGNEVTGNIGPGIAADINSSVDISDATITGNTEEGVRLQHMSIAAVQGTTIAEANGDGPLTCDKSSMAISSLVLKGAKCANIESGTRVKPKFTLVAPSLSEITERMQQARSLSESFKKPK